MKERPVLFSAPMVRAILEGRKTQTRRPYKNRKHPDFGCAMAAPELVCEPQHVIDRTCPYGQPGDRLWVREAFMHEPADYCWEASVSIPSRPAHTVYRADFEGDSRGAGWKPSIHMPRGLSRILLEVTAVRVEQLHDISHADAMAEGMAWDDAVYDYSQLWDRINGPGSWGTNPWVWVITFRRIEQ